MKIRIAIGSALMALAATETRATTIGFETLLGSGQVVAGQYASNGITFVNFESYDGPYNEAQFPGIVHYPLVDGVGINALHASECFFTFAGPIDSFSIDGFLRDVGSWSLTALDQNGVPLLLPVAIFLSDGSQPVIHSVLQLTGQDIAAVRLDFNTPFIIDSVTFSAPVKTPDNSVTAASVLLGGLVLLGLRKLA